MHIPINIRRSWVCKIAGSSIVRLGVDQSTAMSKAWQTVAIIEAMTRGPVSFPFEKVSTGETRWATGILLSPQWQPGFPADQIRFWDIEKEAYRSFLAHTVNPSKAA